jgi:hypothetical protein
MQAQSAQQAQLAQKYDELSALVQSLVNERGGKAGGGGDGGMDIADSVNDGVGQKTSDPLPGDADGNGDGCMDEVDGPLPDMPKWLTIGTGDVIEATDFDDKDEVDDESWEPPHTAVLSVLTTKTLQSPYPSQSPSNLSATKTPTWLLVVVLDPNMENEQSRRREPFLVAAAAEHGNERANDPASYKWTCNKCEKSNDGEESQCTKCNAWYEGPVAVGGWGNTDIVTLLENKWKCEKCTSFNNNGLVACASCEDSRAGGGGTTSTVGTTVTTTATTISAIGANGFSFGYAAQSSTTMDGGAMPAGGFAFGAPAPAATTSSSAPVTTEGVTFGAVALAPASTSSGFDFGDFASAPGESAENQPTNK